METTRIGFWTWIWRARHCRLDRKWLVDFNDGKSQLNSFDKSGVIDVNMDGSVFEEKLSFKMLGLSFSSKLDWCYYSVSIVKAASKKMGALISLYKCLSPNVALYHYKSPIEFGVFLPCLDWCFCYWNTVVMSGLLLPDATWICWIKCRNAYHM